jgi:branched-chain amino acid transport system permease protein
VTNSTLARHVGIGLLALAVVFALSMSLGAYRNVQLAQLAYLVCAAAGLSVLTGLSGQISLGQGAFMAVGAYTTALLFLHADLPLPLVLLAATVVTAAVGGLVGAAAARLRGP